jgi:uncharacterized GH25 family protein
MTLRKPGCFLAMAATVSLRLAAHDYWLEPARPLATRGETVALRLLVGEDLQPDEEREFAAARAPRCELVTAAGRQDLRGRFVEGAKPFGRVELAGEGTHLIVLERTPSTITLEPAEFTGYLREEGLDPIVAEREQRGETNRAGRERYARFLKCYVRAGDQPEAAVPAAALRLDIAPALRADRAMRTGDELRVRVVLDGAPLKQAAVFAAVRRADGKVVTQKATTDDQGWITLRLDTAGLWVVRLVHMQRAPADDVEVDWESFWAACTFGVT